MSQNDGLEAPTARSPGLAMVPGGQEGAAPPAPKNSSLARLGFYLFSEATPPEGKIDDGVVFFSAPGEEREVVEIARRILAEAEKGIPFDHMAVAEDVTVG